MLAPWEFLNLHLDSPESLATVVPALNALVERGLVHVVDLVFVTKAADGSVTVSELDEMSDAVQTAFAGLAGEYGGLLSDEDVAGVAESLPSGATGMALVWENLWAKDLFEAIAGAGGQVTEDLHIPAAIAEPAFASLPAHDADQSSESKE